ncbi:replication initiator protein A [Deinococcus pimensis]|uniref:replication initiator protein A n=1 Tax=Deinococcus pimensis TaxID=309888 RepID=UPI0004854905|nr:replication initiator protein A [Deinococcus pimensis]
METTGQHRPYRDELNLARLGLISLQRDVDPSQTRWESRFVRGDLKCHVEIVAPEGLPHGIDSDVIIAVQTLFAEQGLPDDDSVVTTPYCLRKAAGLVNNGKNYAKLRASLRRLNFTNYVIRDGWWDARTNRWRFSGKTLRMIDDLVFRDSERLDGNVELDARGTLRIRLNPHVVSNIRQGYTRLPDALLMSRLKQPTARAMYRLLDAHRHDHAQPARRVERLEFKLMEWAEHCRIVSDRPDKITRNLDRMHVELLEHGFLDDVTYAGRGRDKTVTYRFGAAARDADPRVVQLLVDAHVVRPMAERLAREFPDHAEAGLALARRLAASSQPRNMPGFVVDVIRQFDAYNRPHPGTSQGTYSPAIRGPQSYGEVRRAPETPEETSAEDREFRELPRELQAERTVRDLRVCLGRRGLDQRLSDRIQAAVLGGLDGWTLRQDVLRAVFERREPTSVIEATLARQCPEV